MDRRFLEAALKDFVAADPGNFVGDAAALRPDLRGMPIFDEPLFGYADAGDPWFLKLKEPGVIGAHFMPPKEWLPEARTVISLFLPFTGRVRAANRADADWPADEWLHARIEGQSFQNMVCRYAAARLEEAGFAAVVPMTDPRFSAGSLTKDIHRQDYYTSNWSERHVAYACGLGTFGLSKGLITRRGVAGRFLSLITAAFFEPDERPYRDIYEYCTRCGACARRCPAGAISPERGKSHPLCSAFLETVLEKHRPRYGCGKCQTGVPCESRIP
jgi:epoxyqueuosine reductase QueG